MKFQEVLISITILAFVLSCKTNTVSIKKQNRLAGTYSYLTTGYYANCEGVKHSLQLSDDSSFTLKVFCQTDQNSSIKPYKNKGKWILKNDSLIILETVSNELITALLKKDTTIQIISPQREEYSFQKE